MLKRYARGDFTLVPCGTEDYELPMPKAIAADWPLIQQLVLEGKSLPDIEAETGVKQGTISSHISRAGIKKIAAKAKSMMQTSQSVTVLDEKTSETEGLTRASSRVRNSLAASLEKLCEKLDSHEPKTLKQAIRLQADLEPAVRNGKTVLGWTDSSQEPLIRIAVMDSLHLPTTPSLQQSIHPVIDVASSTVPQEKHALSDSTPPNDDGQPPLTPPSVNDIPS